ncbi:hypothetical protein [Micromonospora aurantiaca (nom. illeg.)]
MPGPPALPGIAYQPAVVPPKKSRRAPFIVLHVSDNNGRVSE